MHQPRDRREPVTAGWQRRSSALGFSLVEAMIALLVLSVGLLGLAQIQVRVLNSMGLAKAQTTAVNLTQEKIESLRASPFAEIQTGMDEPSERAGDHSRYARRWVVTPTTPGAGTVKHISVTTQWTTPDGDTREVTLTTMVAPRPLAD